MAKSPLRPGAINSQGLRKAFEHRSQNALFSRLFGTAEELKTTFDGLLAVREAQSPMKTREANAVDLRHKVRRTTEIAKGKVDTLANEFMRTMEQREAQALDRAGVRHDPPGGDEVRRALRELKTDKERDAALQAAAKRGDRVVLAAVRNAPSPITLGGFTLPTDQIIGRFVSEQNPGYAEEMHDMATALEHMNILEESFERGADDLRDRQAEEAADAGLRLAEEANRKLRGALGIDPGEAAA